MDCGFHSTSRVAPLGGTGQPFFCFGPAGPILGDMPSKKLATTQKPPGRHRRALVLLASCPDSARLGSVQNLSHI